MKCRCPHCDNAIDFVDEEKRIDSIACPSCGSLINFGDLSNETTAFVASREIGVYKLLTQVGVGQFGSVWKAFDRRLERTIALKIPRHQGLSRTEAELFLREARLAANLTHPNIVRVYDVGYEGENIYIASELIEGANLSQWMKSRKLSLKHAIDVCISVCRALQFAHDSGIIHRDLKPANIMMDMQGVPHVADFGLAKNEATEITMTLEGQILGTPAYMPPEQARGKSSEADARSDVYSIGVILFELLTGELPFRGQVRMLIVQILQDEPPKPRQLNAHIPADLETICLRCLQKDPKKRFQSASELADDLERWKSGEPILSRPSSHWSVFMRWTGRYAQELAGLYCISQAMLTGPTTLYDFPRIANFHEGEGALVRALIISVASIGTPIAIGVATLRSNKWAYWAGFVVYWIMATTYCASIVFGLGEPSAEVVIKNVTGSDLAPDIASHIRMKRWIDLLEHAGIFLAFLVGSAAFLRLLLAEERRKREGAPISRSFQVWLIVALFSPALVLASVVLSAIVSNLFF